MSNSSSTPAPVPSEAASHPTPSEDAANCAPAIVNVDAGDAASPDLGGAVSPTVNVGDVNICLSDTLDVLPGTVANIAADDLIDAVTDADVGDVLSDLVSTGDGGSLVNAVTDIGVSDTTATTTADVLDVLTGAGDCGDGGGLVSAVTDADICATVAHLTGIAGNGDGLLGVLDLADVGAILGGDAIGSLATDTVLDGLVSHANLLDIPDTGGLLGDHA